MCGLRGETLDFKSLKVEALHDSVMRPMPYKIQRFKRIRMSWISLSPPPRRDECIEGRGESRQNGERSHQSQAWVSGGSLSPVSP